ncbi:hypothetical protein [Streptomyces sp. RP5T]|uniref:hypothetical protein n=1 Tax=Streptomyces sp. RP5T TaxID=2490848 RepID=UPI000F655D56|nr:hypothetical protein [Streptomyces sp. RP5T]RRR87015.1 hypothetical protein EHS43_02630 [Streptomyces sp. RP5T]
MSESAQSDRPETQENEPQVIADEVLNEVESRPAVAAARAHAERNIAKAKSGRNAAAEKDGWTIVLPAVLAGLGGLFLLMSWGINQNMPAEDKTGPDSGWGASACLALSVVLFVVYRVRAVSRSAVFQELVRGEELNVRMAELDFVPETDAPLSANRALLQEYHRLSTSQARAAFRLATWVMGAAALLVLAGAAAVVVTHDTATAVTLASLTAFISALGGYISSTLLSTYRVSVEQARFYFREPLAGGYLLAAEHLAKRLDPPEHTAALGRVVDGFIHAATNVPGATAEPALPQDLQQDPSEGP